MSENHVIGVGGGLPWRLPDDMKHFMRTTRGHTVIMGRKTWESMEGPLRNRRNIVITTQRDYEAPGGEVVHSFEAALRLAPVDEEEVFIIGGEAVFRAALPLAGRLYLTMVHGEFEGDALFPPFDKDQWRIVREEQHPADEHHRHAFTIRVMERAA